MFTTTARYALVLAFALGTMHFNGASARAEKCDTAIPDHTGKSFSSLSVGPPVAVGEMRNRALTIGGTSVVRFSVARYFTDPDSDNLTYSAASDDSTVATVEMCGSILKIVAKQNGTTDVTVEASDGTGSQPATHSFCVSVGESCPSAPNNGPVPDSTIADTTFTQKTSPISFFVSPYFSDLDGDTLTYSSSVSPTGVVTTSITDSTLTLTAVSKGTATVTVTATDPSGEDTTQVFQATIANSPPVPDSTIADTTFTKNNSPISFFVSPYFSDPDPKDRNRLTYSSSVSPTGVVTTSITDSTLTLTAVSKGTATVTVTATDPSGEDTTQVFQATIANSPPVPDSTIADTTFTKKNSPISFFVSPYFIDLDGDTLTYSSSVSPTGKVEASITDSTLTLTAVSRGTATVTVTATDPSGEDTTQVFEATFANSWPEKVGSIPDTTLTKGETISFDVWEYFTDPDPEDALSYRKHVFTNSYVASLSISDSTLTITGDSVGTSLVGVSAWDPSNEVATQPFYVTVSSASQPLSVDIASGPMTTINSGAENTWKAKASGGTSSYTYSWDYATECVGSGHSPGDASCVWRWIINAGTDSSFSQTITTAHSLAGVRVTATDSKTPTAASVMDSVIVSVNHAPNTVGTIGARTVLLGRPDVSFSVAGFFTDSDGDNLAYPASSSNNSVATVSVSGSTLTIKAVATGTATVTVTATDPGGLSSPAQEFTVTVNRPIVTTPEPPSPPLEPTLDPPLYLRSTPGNEQVRLTWSPPFYDPGDITGYAYRYRESNQYFGFDAPVTWSDIPGGANARSYTVTGLTNGLEYMFEVRAENPNGGGTSANTTVTVPNRSPVVDRHIPDQTLTADGSSVTFNLRNYFSDPDGDDLTFSASSSNSISVSASISSLTDLVITPGPSGSATVTVTARDGDASVSQTVAVRAIKDG